MVGYDGIVGLEESMFRTSVKSTTGWGRSVG
jgi:hypothetical protein